MVNGMRVMSWNVQGAVPPFGSIDRIQRQIEFIGANAGSPDVLMLNEVTTVQRDRWRELLRDDLGYSEQVDTLDWAAELRESDVPPHQDFGHVNGNLIAIHETFDGRDLSRRSPSIREGPWEKSALKDWDTNFPEKVLNAEFELRDSTIELWNVRTVPGSMYGEEKIKILENTFGRMTKGESRRQILAGDLNAPKAERPDGTVVSWGEDREGNLGERWIRAELDILTGLGEYGMVDVFRDQHGYDDLAVPDVSFQTKRFDHVLASESLNPIDCRYDHDGFECSDHAPIIAEFKP